MVSLSSRKSFSEERDSSASGGVALAFKLALLFGYKLRKFQCSQFLEGYTFERQVECFKIFIFS